MTFCYHQEIERYNQFFFFFFFGLSFIEKHTPKVVEATFKFLRIYSASISHKNQSFDFHFQWNHWFLYEIEIFIIFFHATLAWNRLMCQHFATRMGPPNQAYEKSNFRRIFCKLYKYQRMLKVSKNHKHSSSTNWTDSFRMRDKILRK